ncbi:MAG: CPXCG motif-containing cysteine-rich protein [Gammaproteobacteria bacterium]|nr:CPXCG motif-containing cysteine-rich protein [Gammaproteobacteria bacterium]MDH3429309.1 CPXCG motif-containing cysteine-rich protein [Gammaproteobacteria bacterium]
MSTWLPERRIDCPFCGESITIVVDPSAGPQSYVEDCQVCCQPMQISIEAENGELRTVGVGR